MATYAKAINPDSVEFHTAQANAAHAITMAEIYLSLNGLPSNPQCTSSSHSHLPAAILTSATTLSGPPNATRHISLATNTGETISLQVTTANDTVMQEVSYITPNRTNSQTLANYTSKADVLTKFEIQIFPPISPSAETRLRYQDLS